MPDARPDRRSGAPTPASERRESGRVGRPARGSHPARPAAPPPPAEPPSWSQLYAEVSDLTLRAQSGAAEQVLGELDAVLLAARDAGAQRIVHRALYAMAMCDLVLGRLDDCVQACNDLVLELSDDPVDRGWRSSSASMIAIVNILRGENAAAFAGLVEAGIRLRDAPPRGPGYFYALNGLGVGYLAMRLYEPALEQYEHAAEREVFTQYTLTVLFSVLNAQLAHLYWGLELDRIGSADASRHFEEALELGARARSHLLPGRDQETWEWLLEARDGLCRAFLGEPTAAISQLEPVIEPLARHNLDEAVMARVGLVRAYSTTDRVIATAHAERARLSVGHTTDYAVALSASWEQARLELGDSDAHALADYASLLAAASWEDRTRLAAAMTDQVAAEIARRQQVREAERLLYDKSTGLPNRLSFLQRLSSEVASAGQDQSHVGVAFLVLEPNALDEVFDKLVATLQVDFLARYDTSELAAIGRGLDGQELANRIQACGPDVLRHVRAGIASMAAPPSVTGLVLHADEALLTARQRGGVQVNSFAG